MVSTRTQGKNRFFLKKKGQPINLFVSAIYMINQKQHQNQLENYQMNLFKLQLQYLLLHLIHYKMILCEIYVQTFFLHMHRS